LGYAGLQPDDPKEIGPFRLLGQLGSGGMGRVFLGMSAGGRPIAVKVIRTELATDPYFRARFRSEVAAAQKVSGLFTAFVVDADLDGPVPWLATAYVAGPSLTEAVRGHGPLRGHGLMALAAGLAEGLGAIHAAGVVHRDLKPSNVLLAEDGPRVIDFGISEAAEASAAAGANVMIGSPGYMSPEQVLGLDIGPASDMFSLGAVLTFAATGQGPFGTGSHTALMYRLVNSPANLDDVPDELRSLVGRCLAKHPGDRPTAPEMLVEVEALRTAPGWLAEFVTSSSAKDEAVADADLGPADAGDLIAVAEAFTQPPSPGQPPSSGEALYRDAYRPGRHRVSRTLASACITAGLVAGSGVAAFALIGANRSPADNSLQPQAGAGVVVTAPSSAANPSASPDAASSAAPSKSTPVSPSAYLSPASAALIGSSLPPTPITPSSAVSSSSAKAPASASAHPASSSPAPSSSSPAPSSSSPAPSSSSPAPSSPAPSSPAPSSPAPSSPSSPAPSSPSSPAPSSPSSLSSVVPSSPLSPAPSTASSPASASASVSTSPSASST
jgi:eukaryotic-like serine/threonine-protein kinase